MSTPNRLGAAALVLGIAALGITIANAETAPPPNDVTTISGVARVIDGRTLSVDRTYVQLEGVDAAEIGTPWGDYAWRMLTDFVADSKGGVTCKLTGSVDATNGRALGRCYVEGDDKDVAGRLIVLGAALACPAEVGDRYDSLEKFAEEKRGSGGKQPRSSRCARGK